MTDAATSTSTPPRSLKDQLTDHEYDGIREYDNPTPGWWHAIFLSSILFSLFYWTFFSFSPLAWTPQERWQKQQVAEYQRIFGELGDLAPDQPTILKLRSNGQLMQVALGMFQSNCAQCHAKDGGGINGVNLCDDTYKNVEKVADIYNVITKGAAVGAMPTWENRLSTNERVLLASYVASLRGSTPASPRAPEGKPIPAWPTDASN